MADAPKNTLEREFQCGEEILIARAVLGPDEYVIQALRGGQVHPDLEPLVRRFKPGTENYDPESNPADPQKLLDLAIEQWKAECGSKD